MQMNQFRSRLSRRLARAEARARDTVSSEAEALPYMLVGRGAAAERGKANTGPSEAELAAGFLTI